MAATVVGEPVTGSAGTDARVAVVREFGRFWARDVVRRLDGGLAGSSYSPTEARVIFDLGSGGPAELARLRGICGIDAGRLARVVHRLRNEGVVVSTPSPGPAGPVIGLTVHGQEVLAVLDRQIAEHARSILAGLREDRQRDVVAAMGTIRRALSGDSGEPFRLRPPRAGDLGWVVQQHGAVYADECGWDKRFEGEVAALVSEFAVGRDPARERAWIAEVDAVPAGSVFCLGAATVDGAAGTWMAGGAVDRGSCSGPGTEAGPTGSAVVDDARLALLLVDPAARGLGLGRRLVGECVAFARRAGYRRLVLRTEDVFVSAERIAEAAGFRLVDECPHRRYGRQALSRDWILPLDPVDDRSHPIPRP